MPGETPQGPISGSRSVATGSNQGIIVTGDNSRILTNQRKQKLRRPKRVVYGEIPGRPPAFQMRESIRSRLVNAGNLAVISTLTGARGIGKTQLAAAYARECIDSGWSLVAWIGAERPDQILAGLDQLSRVMGLHDESDDSESAARKVRRWLESSGSKRCLIVFDNASDPDLLTCWLPSAGNARIVITSNRRSFESLGTLIDVEAFTASEAQAYLLERTKLHDEAGASSLSNEVGRLPLALAQASAVIIGQRLSYSEFLDRLRKVPLDKYLIRQPGDAYPRGAAEAVLLAIEQAERHGRLAAALLLILSVLSPDGVSREFLYSAPITSVMIRWPWRAGHTVLREEIDAALEQLVEASLVTVSFDGQMVIMHRFTQRVIRERAKRHSIYPLVLFRVSRFMAEQRNFDALDWKQRETTEHLIQQISSVWNNAAIESKADVAAIFQGASILGRWVGRRFVRELMGLRMWSVAELSSAANLSRAIQLGISVLRDCEQIFSSGDADTLQSRRNLAVAYKDAARFDEAIELHRQNLDTQQRILGPDHPDTLHSRTKLAYAYDAAGRFDEAIDLHRQTVADFERILGPHHPDTLTRRSNLAYSFNAAGRFDEGIELNRQTLASRERILGPGHSDTLTSRNNLAYAYSGAGRFDKAIDLDRQTLASRERILGPDHPDTLRSRTNLAYAYHATARFDKAIDLHRQNLTIRERILGPDHPDTVNNHNRLAESRKQNAMQRQASMQRSRRRR